MNLSLNEFQATLAKAAKGAGFATGLGEELVKAAVWLSVNGHKGGEAALSGLNTGVQKSLMGSVGPTIITSSKFYAVTDSPSVFELAACANREVRALLTGVDAPLLTMGYAGVAAKAYGLSSEIQFGNGSVAMVDAYATDIYGEIPDQPCDILIVCEVEDMPTAKSSSPDRIEVDENVWQALNVHAAKTYVPASEASRLKGAGAGLTDND